LCWPYAEALLAVGPVRVRGVGGSIDSPRPNFDVSGRGFITKLTFPRQTVIDTRGPEHTGKRGQRILRRLWMLGTIRRSMRLNLAFKGGDAMSIPREMVPGLER